MEQGVHVGGWEVVGEIDRGAMTCLYEGRSSSGDPIAVEVMLPEPALDPAARARFLRGAGSQSAVRHPSLVRVHAAGDGPPAPFVVCDLHAGPHLADRLRAGDLPVGDATDRLGDVAEALDALHDAGTPHGALQPDAVLGDGPHALLTSVGRGGSGPGGLIAEAFRAPELTAELPATPAADRFALAGVLFLALTGGLPFAAPGLDDPPTMTRGKARQGLSTKAAKRRRDRAEAVAQSAVSAAGDVLSGGRTPTPVQALRPELPSALDAVFADALAPDPAARPDRGETLVEAVRTALGPEGLALGPAPATAALGLPSRAAGPGPTLEIVSTNGHSPVGDPTAVLTSPPAPPEPAPAPPPAPAAAAAPPPVEPAPPLVARDIPAAAAVRYVHVAPPVSADWKKARRGGFFRRWFVRLFAFVFLCAAGAAVAAAVLHFVHLHDKGDGPAPALADGEYTVGSALEPGGIVTRDCLDRRGTGGSPGCSILQVSLNDEQGKGRRLVVPRTSTIKTWSIRGAKGSMSIQVLRRVGGQTRQVARSPTITVPDSGVHSYKVSMTVQPGDHVGLLLNAGAAIGVRTTTTGALTERWQPPLGSTPRRPTFTRSKGYGYELMMRVDLQTRASQKKSAATGTTG